MQLSKKNITQFFVVMLWIILIPAIAWIGARDAKIAAMLVVGILGTATCLVCILNYRLGFYIYMTISLILPLLERMAGTELPMGVVMDGLLGCSLLGCFFKGGDPSAKKVDFLKDPLLISIYLYLLLLILQIANPYGFSVSGWFIFIRVTFRNLLFLYLGLHVFNSMKDVYVFFKYWLFMGTLAAIYACMQQWMGLMPYERAFIAKYPQMFNTTIIISGIRIFSFMADAASFGIIMACNIVIIMIMLTAKMAIISLPKKILMIISLVLHVLALGFSGTRTGYVMIPLGLMLFFIANLQKKNTILIAGAFGFFAMVILFGPFHSNPTIVRVRTAFLGKQDESVNVRDRNRAKAQPYIYSHPFGGGLMTTGGNALIFHPGHPMANLQTDNGYLRAVLETGWLGILLMGANFVILIAASVGNFFRMKSELDKLLMISMAAAVLEIALAQYAQDASTLVESAIMLNAFTAIVIKIKYLYS
jgi:putative inorganic carbon (HCO3(-)) transporter